jgi:lipopolysaccharide biosynthesis protein
VNIRDYLKPFAWTRSSNVSGFAEGTYDVVGLWHNDRGPAGDSWCDVAFYTEQQVDELLKSLGITEGALEKISGRKT